MGNTVNIKEATYTNDIGDAQLATVWTDPDFDPSQHAVYYVRVLEIPTPRWTTYDAKALGIDPLPQPDVIRVPVAFPLRTWDERLREFVNHWIEIRRRDCAIPDRTRPESAR